MIKWYDKKEQKLNIKDIIKVIDILPCSWTDGYYAYNGKYNLMTPVPVADGDYLIYSVCDISDGWEVFYYKCLADGTIVEFGIDDHEDDETED